MKGDKDNPVVDTTETTEAEVKSVSQEQVDKIVKERLERERAKFQKEMEQSVKKAQEEAERMAKLSADEREKEVLTKTQKEIEEQRREISLRENKLTAIEKLSEAKVPLKLVDFVVTEDPEKTEDAINRLVETYQEAVAQGVADRLKGNPPKDVTSKSDAPKDIRRTL